MTRNKAGIYIHVPFCSSKCHYCDFYSLAGAGQELQCEYLQAVGIELKLRSGVVQGQTLYIGGGTPTCLTAEQLKSLLINVREEFHLAADAEITVEANPGTLTEDRVQALADGGVNRISLGVQALQPELLTVLGRRHNPHQVECGIKRLREAGITNINADCIFGIPGQSTQDLLETMQWLLAQGVVHISLYPLELPDGTQLAQLVAADKLHLPADEQVVEMLFAARKLLIESGMVHYEIANFAVRGAESQHNLIYWRNQEYLGFGPGAHSYWNGVRFGNCPNLAAYIESLTSGDLPPTMVDPDSRRLEVRRAETVILGLRLLEEGVSKQRFQERFGVALEEHYGKVINLLTAEELLVNRPDRILLTKKAIPIANQVFVHFL